MKKFILILSLLLFINVIFAQENYSSYIKKEIGEYPEASAINIYTEIELTINDDYSYNYRVFYIKKILTYKGKKRYSDVDLTYWKDYENIELGDCCTIKSDGSRIEIPPEAFHDSENYMTIMSPDYINIWEKVINFPEIEPGNFIVMNYTLKNTRKDCLSGIEHMMESNPYLEKKFIIKYPRKLKVYIKPLNELENLTHRKDHDKDFTTETYVIKNAESIPEEYYAPNYIYSGCPIVYTGFKNWKVLGKKIFDEYSSGLIISDSINAKSLELTQDSRSDEDKVFAIYQYFADNFTVKNSDIKCQEFRPEDLNLTISRKFGSQRDLTALFVVMLKAAGIKNCAPALALDPYTEFQDIQKNNAILGFLYNYLVYWDGKLLYPGNDTFKFGYAGIDECNLIIGEDKPYFTKYVNSEPNLIDKSVNCMPLSDGQYHLEYDMKFLGNKDYYYRSQFKNESEEKAKIRFSSWRREKSDIIKSGPKFINLNDLRGILQLQYSTDAMGFAIVQSPYEYLTLPLEKINIDTGSKTRQLPYLINNSTNIQEEYIINGIPDNIELISPQKSFDRSFKYGSQTMTCEFDITLKGDDLIFKRNISIPRGIIKLKDYNEFRNFINDLKNPVNGVIFYKQK